MTGCDTVTDVGLAWMSGGCPALEHLEIVGCVQARHGGVLGCSLLLLDRWMLLLISCQAGCQRSVMDDTCALWWPYEFNLLCRGGSAKQSFSSHRVDVSALQTQRPQVSNAGVTSLCERCPLLTHLGMSGLKHVTDTGVARLSAGCPRLTHLDMSGLINLSDGMQRDVALTGVQVGNADVLALPHTFSRET